MKVGVLGGGSWATAIVKMLKDNKHEVFWWMRDDAQREHLIKFHHNPKYLSSVQLDFQDHEVSTDLNYVLKNSDIVFIAIPSIQGVNRELLKSKLLVSAIKGIVPGKNLIVGDYLKQEFNVPLENIGVVAGPCHAEEVAFEKLSYLTCASVSTELSNTIASLLASRYIKTTTSDDIYGTEYGAVLKNVFAIASGICHGLGFGDNFQAVLISNAIQEMEAFIDAVHPIKRDINDSAYLGDLLVTAYSQFSRNRTFGNMIGRGYSVKSAQFEMNMVAEGYYATACIHDINREHKVNMPICRTVYAILYENISPQIEIRLLAEQLQ
jgi:glycerol-3-phosphate dehydrogenase (NAD(P)+)